MQDELVEEDARLLSVLVDTAVAVATALSSFADRRAPGERPGQYALDLVADAAACGVLHQAGLVVLSEESGLTGPDGSSLVGSEARAGAHPLLAVVDPVDGSTNASLGLPWYATSVCIVDGEGPRVGLVVNQALGTRYEAVRGRGARRDGAPIASSRCGALRDAVIGVSGLPVVSPGWAQFRALGAAALDLCAVAEGVLDGFRVAGRSALHGWDYLAALLVCREAGAVAGELDGRDLIVRDASPRRPVVGATASLHDELAAAPI